MDDILIELQKLIGRRFRYKGIDYQVIEVLAKDHVLVISGQNLNEVQTDQFGEPRRHCPETHMVPLQSDTNQDLHPLVLALLHNAEAEKLRHLLARASPLP